MPRKENMQKHWKSDQSEEWEILKEQFNKHPYSLTSQLFFFGTILCLDITSGSHSEFITNESTNSNLINFLLYYLTDTNLLWHKKYYKTFSFQGWHAQLSANKKTLILEI